MIDDGLFCHLSNFLRIIDLVPIVQKFYGPRGNETFSRTATKKVNTDVLIFFVINKKIIHSIKVKVSDLWIKKRYYLQLLQEEMEKFI